MTRVVIFGLFVGFCVGLNIASAQVGPCSSDIAQIESALRQPGSDVGPTLSPTIGAQLDKEPMPGFGGTRRGEGGCEAQGDTRACPRVGHKGDRAGCSKAVERIKLLIGM